MKYRYYFTFSIFIFLLFPCLLKDISGVNTDSLNAIADTTPNKNKATKYNEFAGYLLKKDILQSIRYGKLALKYASENNDIKNKYYAYNNIANAYLLKDTLNKALRFSMKALETAYETGDSLLIARAEFETGSAYTEKGYFDEALNHLIKSLKIIENNNFEGSKRYLAIIDNNIGVVYNRMSNYKKALEFYEKSLEYKTGLNDSAGIANMLNNIGLVYSNLNDFDKAIEYYKKSLKIKKRFNNRLITAETLYNIWSLYLEQNKYEKALDFYNNELKNYTSDFSDRITAMFYTDMGKMFLNLGRYNEAKKYLMLSEIKSKKSGFIDILAKAYHLLALYYEKTGDYKNAYAYNNMYIKVHDSVLNRDIASKTAEIQVKYETEKKEKQIAILEKEKEIKQAEITRQRALKLAYLAISVLAVIIAVVIIFRIRLTQKRKQLLLELKNMETEQRLLRTQMNPHFIFNSLNSVQSFISSNDNYNAMIYLSDFGHLMRKILENSRKDFITVDNEIETLHLYIKMERLRNKNNFEYKISTGENLDTENTLIPPLIVQPFVENAIKHGIFKIKKGAFLSIEFKIVNNSLNIIVRDNGIGRRKSAELQNLATPGHKSLGMELTNERLKRLEKKLSVKASYKITDLYDSSGNAAGTMVVIILPFITYDTILPDDTIYKAKSSHPPDFTETTSG